MIKFGKNLTKTGQNLIKFGKNLIKVGKKLKKIAFFFIEPDNLSQNPPRWNPGLDNPAVAEGLVPRIHGTVVDVQGLDLGDMPDVDLLDVDLLDVHVEGHHHGDAINPTTVE